MTGTRAQEKRWRVMREIGRPAMMGEADLARVRAHLRSLNARGMSYNVMAAQSGVADSTLTYLVTRNEAVTRRTYDAVMALYFEEPGPEFRGSRLPIHGAQRRLQALQAQGFGMAVVGRMILDGGRSDRHQMTRDGTAQHIHYRMYRQIVDLYDKLDGVDPLDLGIPQSTVTKAKNIARKRRFPPRSCWDTHTIDDPQAFAEWTGVCGTTSGPGVHKREKIPLCRACLEVKYAQRVHLKERRASAAVQGVQGAD